MSAEPSVHIGLWRDFSHDGVKQLTLTLPSRWGNYLISAMSLLVSIAGSSLWTIIAYALHQLHVSKSDHDPTRFRVQVLLRNSASATSAITDAFFVFNARSKKSSRDAVRRISPVFTLALLCLVLFALAGTFVSGVTTHSESRTVVLAQPESCGGWFFNWTAVDAPLATSLDRLASISKDTIDARLYSKWFYEDDLPLSIQNSRFPIRRLPYSAKMKSCPFKGENRCLGNTSSVQNSAMTWDSGLLDSHIHLGINTPKEDRVNIRKILTCSPINVDDLVKRKVENGVVQFDLGRLFNFPVTQSFSQNMADFGLGYAAWCEFWWGITKQSYWAAEPFDRDDADLSICFVHQNSVIYPEPVNDPLFLAGEKITFKDGSFCYIAANYFNTIACLDHVQFCNPQIKKCTNITHAAAAYLESRDLDLNPNQETTINRTAMLLGLTPTARLGIGSLGAAGLIARDKTYNDLKSAALPPNQWQMEAQLWFETGLALLQSHTLRFLDRIDLSNPSTYGSFLIFTPLDKIPDKALRDAAETSCYNQKFTTTALYQNFRFFQLMLIIIASLCIIATSFLLEPCVKFFRRFYITPGGQVRQLARDTDSKFSLLQIVLESVGVGPWKGRKSGTGNLSIDNTELADITSMYQSEDSSSMKRLLQDNQMRSGNIK